MNPYVITLILVASSLAFAFILLFIGGLLVRTDLHRSLAEKRGLRYPRSRILKDLRPVQNVMLEFLAESKPTHDLLKNLERNGFFSFRALLHEYRSGLGEEDRSTPVQKLFTAMFILGAAGLVRFGTAGLSHTDIGREVLRRLKGVSFGSREDVSSPGLPHELIETTSTTTLRNDTPGTSQLGFVKHASRRAHVPASIHRIALESTTAPSTLISAADHYELTAAIVSAKKLAIPGVGTRKLQEKLTSSTVVDSADLPSGVITMGTRTELLDPQSQERVTFTLVYPIDANVNAGRISVFEPLGAAMLGRRVNDQFTWSVPHGFRTFEVTAVHFQPEAAIARVA